MNNFPFYFDAISFVHFGMICNLYLVVAGLSVIFNNLIYHIYLFCMNSRRIQHSSIPDGLHKE